MTPEREQEISAAIRANADYHRAPAGLAEDVLAALPAEEAPRRPAWFGWLAQGAALAGVAFLTWALTVAGLRPGEDERHAEDVLAAHVRATLGHHLIDVASSNQHTVKPWLSARLPYSPPVADLSAQGFVLEGARLEQVRGQPLAVLVYRRRLHVIDAYVWPERGGLRPVETERDGFQMRRFAAGEWGYWLVSDLNRAELNDLARLLGAGG